MASFQLSGPAVRDLREIYDWIAEDDPVAADRVMLDLREAIERFVDVPDSGTSATTWVTQRSVHGPSIATSSSTSPMRTP